MHKVLNSLLFLVMFGAMQSYCSPVESFAEYPTSTSALPEVATAFVPTSPEIIERLPKNTLESTSPASTLAQAATDTKIFLPTVTMISATAPAVGFIANNLAVEEFASIPASEINAAAAKRVMYYHQSTGEYIHFLGLECLAGNRTDPSRYPQECLDYAQNPGYYSLVNWRWPIWQNPQADAIKKMDDFVSLVPGVQQNYDIIGMKFCYVDGHNVNFDDYRTKMENLERQYPNKIFIWSTSALWADPGGACNPTNNSCRNISEFNNQVRQYALANEKPLFDLADIESKGGQCLVEGYEGLCPEFYADGGGHPNTVASIRLAKGFWWLIAKISGEAQ